MKHTPGPWRIIEHNWSDTGIFANNERIASLSIEDEYANSEEGQELAQGRMLVQSANAHLIAAAPDLLEACKRSLLFVPEGKISAEIKAAIKKAEGVQ